MSQKMPLITSVKRRMLSPVTDEGRVVVICEVETVDGTLLLQLTQNAAHELSALLDRFRPRVSPSVSVKRSG
jgi:predicted neuraminidase